MEEKLTGAAESALSEKPDAAGPVHKPDDAGPVHKSDAAEPFYKPDAAGPVHKSDAAGPVHKPDAAEPVNEPDASGQVRSLDDFISEAYSLPERDWSQYSPLSLAWLGDTVFDLVVRTVIVKSANMAADKLHKKASMLVNARRQSDFAKTILPLLSPEEAAVYRRGRNSSPRHSAKNAGRREYLEATGFESLIGYLYLQGRYERILELASACMSGTDF